MIFFGNNLLNHVSKKNEKICVFIWKYILPLKLPIRFNGWTYDRTAFFISDAQEWNILGNENLPHVGTEVAQKPFPHYKNSIERKSYKNSVGLYKKETETIFRKFNQFFRRFGEMKNQLKLTHFHDPLKPIQKKGVRFRYIYFRR